LNIFLNQLKEIIVMLFFDLAVCFEKGAGIRKILKKLLNFI
jgi:hypothetical protein